MYKLLPPESRESVRGEYLMRRAVVLVCALILVEVIALVGLLPSYLMSKVRQEEVSAKAQMALNQPASENLRAWYDSFNEKLKALNPKLDQDKPSEDIRKVLARKGSGVRLTSLVWSKTEGQASVSISGVARDRQSLLTLESRLNGSGEFTDVTLPVSNLAKDKDIPFQLKLILKKAP